MPCRSIWSLHDVGPATMESSTELIDRLSAAGVHPVCILVVPCGDWTPSQIATLHAWQAAGHVLAAHGWTHTSLQPHTLHHRAHSLVFSRDAAEHLGRTGAEVRQIVEAGPRWFRAVGLEPPTLYVPPAWAMGNYALSQFEETPFDWVETLTGIYDVRARRMRRLPLVGFEADTAVRAGTLRALNACNQLMSRLTRRPLRIAIHPNDLRLRLSDDVLRLLTRRHTVAPLSSIGEPTR